MSYEVFGEWRQADPSQLPAYCPECAWNGCFEECPDGEDRAGNDVFLCPDCGMQVHIDDDSYEVE